MKKNIQEEVHEMAKDMVLLDYDNVLAWKLDIEWQDVVSLDDYDSNLLVKFIHKFPKEKLSKVLTGYIRSDISPYDPKILEKEVKGKKPIKKKDDTSIQTKLEDSEDAETNIYSTSLIMEYLTDGFSNDSVLSHRVLCAFYVHIREYESSSDTAIKGINLIKNLKKTLGISFKNSLNDLNTLLGTSYIYYQAPKNHDEAIKLFNQVLEQNKNLTLAKIGKGLVYRESRKYTQAAKILKSVLDENTTNLYVLFEYSWCLILLGDFDAGRKGIAEFLKSLTGNDPRSQDLRAQSWWRIGQSYWQESVENKKQDSNNALDDKLNSLLFNAFSNALKENQNFAPAFTSLGKFYSKLGDNTRSTKCYYRAFELDGGELDAAEELAKEFANSMNWELVEVVATRVLESEHIRYSGKSLTWPTRVLGIASLNKDDYGSAVKYFQNTLRIDDKDTTSWIGLGEAYRNSGRYDGAKKTFERAQSLDPTSWVATYELATVLRTKKEFNEAARIFKRVVASNPEEAAPRTALIETLLLSAQNVLYKEIYQQAVILATECVNTATKFLINKSIPSTQDIWRVLGQCCEIFLSVRSSIDKAPFDDLHTLAITFSGVLDSNELISQLSAADEANLKTVESLTLDATPITKISQYYLLFFKLSLHYSRNDKSSTALGWYNLGLSQLKLYLLLESLFSQDEILKYIYASMESFKKTIGIVNTNPDVWNAYGIASSYVNAKVSQHCFIRSLALDSHQSSPWNNLAILYLRLGDIQLSEEAVEKSLAYDPEFFPAWIGKGIVEYTTGSVLSARKSFQHAFKISRSTNEPDQLDRLSKLYYALSVFEFIQDKGTEKEAKDVSLHGKIQNELEESVLSLQKYLKLVPDSALAINLEGLILERVSDYEYAIEYCTKLCTIHEENYEEFEREEDLVKFVRAKAHLARVALGAERYEEAIEHGQFAIDVSSDLAESNVEAAIDLKKSRLSAFLTSGLGCYFTKNYSNSIECFKNALAESDEDQDVVVLLAQVLWAHGGTEEREVALEQLFGSIEQQGSSSLSLSLTLGAIGITHDSDIIDAAKDELGRFSQEFLQKEDPKHHVPLMLAAMNEAQGQKAVLPWLKSAFYEPWNFENWKRIDNKIALIETALQSHGNVTSIDLSNAYASQEGFTQVQKGVFYAPWNPTAWIAFSSLI